MSEEDRAAIVRFRLALLEMGVDTIRMSDDEVVALHKKMLDGLHDFIGEVRSIFANGRDLLHMFAEGIVAGARLPERGEE